jgi:hypothetical protein
MIYLHSELYLPRFSISLIITISQKTREIFPTTSNFLFYNLQKYCLNKIWTPSQIYYHT